MTEEVIAQLKFLRMSPKKVRLVADLIRGRRVGTAVNILMLLNKKAARPVLKLLQSAMANAKNNFMLTPEDLRVKKIIIDGGPMLKRWMPRAHGRATPIRERTSHIKLIISQVEKKSEIRNPKSETNSKSK